MLEEAVACATSAAMPTQNETNAEGQPCNEASH